MRVFPFLQGLRSVKSYSMSNARHTEEDLIWPNLSHFLKYPIIVDY